MSEPGKKKRGLSLPSWIMSGTGAGVAVGRFVGEPAAALEPFGDAFTGLLQTSIPPHMSFFDSAGQQAPRWSVMRDVLGRGAESQG